MNRNQTSMKNVDDDINLKDIILEIWKHKIMVICMTMIFAILTGVISIFFISPVYTTKLNIIISMPEKYQTRYGEYILPLTTNEQYIQLITSNDILLATIRDLNLSDKTNVESLRNSINISNSSETAQTSNTFEISISADNAADSLAIAESIYSNYINFLDIILKEQVVNYFYNNFTVDLISLENKLEQEQNLLKYNEELLSQTTMDFKTNNSSIEILEQMGEDSNYIIPVDTLNPNYIKIETDIIKNKQSINYLLNTIDMTNRYIKELGTEKQVIENYYENGKTDKLNINLMSIIESNIYMPSQPVAPLSKTSPSIALNIIIGTVVGGMIGIMIVLFQWYWNKER